MINVAENIKNSEEVSRNAFSFLWGIFKFFFKFLVAIGAALLSSILIEIIGLTFFWHDEGADRSAEILAKEVQYIESEELKSAVMDDESKVVFDRAVKGYSRFTNATGFSSVLNSIGEYGEAIRNITIVFFIRLSVILSVLVLYFFVTFWCVVEGMLFRAKRRWSNAVERSFVFHHLKGSLFWLVVLPIPIYLMIPFAVHPVTIVAPFMFLYSVLLVLSIGFFKKVL